MALTLAKIAANTASVTFEVSLQAEDGTTNKQPVTVVYYPGRVTERALAQLQGFSSLNESNVVGSLESFNMTLASLIKSWDVYEDEAETIMFPLKADRLAELPLMFRISVISAIMRDIRPEAMALQA